MILFHHDIILWFKHSSAILSNANMGLTWVFDWKMPLEPFQCLVWEQKQSSKIRSSVEDEDCSSLSWVKQRRGDSSPTGNSFQFLLLHLTKTVGLSYGLIYKVLLHCWYIMLNITISITLKISSISHPKIIQQTAHSRQQPCICHYKREGETRPSFPKRYRLVPHRH